MAPASSVAIARRRPPLKIIATPAGTGTILKRQNNVLEIGSPENRAGQSVQGAPLDGRLRSVFPFKFGKVSSN